MALEILIDEARKASIRSLYDDRLSLFPDAIAVGGTLPLSIGVVDRIQNPWTSRKFTPQDLTSTTFRAAISTVAAGVSPAGGLTGSIPFTFEAADTTTQTTAEIDIDELDATALELALNALSKVVAIGGVTVTQLPSPSSDLQFLVSFEEVGTRNLLSGDIGNLAPVAICDVERLQTGDADTREVQLVRIVPNAAAIVTLSTAAASAAATLTNPQDGGAGANEQFRVTLTGNIYKGSWTFSKTGGGTSAAILFDDTEAQIKAKLEATSGIGTNNVNVTQEDEHTWLIEMIGSLANTAVAASVSGTNLVAIPEKTGTLDLRTPAVKLLLNGSVRQVVTLEIEKTVGTDPPTKILSQDLILFRPDIEASMTAPAFAGKSQNGITAIGSGVDLIAVVFPYEFASVPSQVIAIIEKPSGGDNIFATVRRDTITTTGFTAELSGATPDANHKLSWVAIL
jgi:hypothetical protein